MWCRNDALQRFAVLQVQWQQLAAQLRPLAKHYVAHPKVLVDTQSKRVVASAGAKAAERIVGRLHLPRALAGAAVCARKVYTSW